MREVEADESGNGGKVHIKKWEGGHRREKRLETEKREKGFEADSDLYVRETQ